MLGVDRVLVVVQQHVTCNTPQRLTGQAQECAQERDHFQNAVKLVQIIQLCMQFSFSSCEVLQSGWGSQALGHKDVNVVTSQLLCTHLCQEEEGLDACEAGEAEATSERLTHHLGHSGLVVPIHEGPQVAMPQGIEDEAQ